jgi:hypothetical protein
MALVLKSLCEFDGDTVITVLFDVALHRSCLIVYAERSCLLSRSVT